MSFEECSEVVRKISPDPRGCAGCWVLAWRGAISRWSKIFMIDFRNLKQRNDTLDTVTRSAPGPQREGGGQGVDLNKQ